MDAVTHVIGHSRLCRVVGQQEACWIESVVILKEKRGKGLGKLLMEMTEDYAKRMGVSLIHLSTHDKQEFYKKLGYTFCSPVQLLGSPSQAFNKVKCKLLKSKITTNSSVDQATSIEANTNHTEATSSELVSCTLVRDMKEESKLKIVIPPPPPFKQSCTTNSVPKKQWMKKTI